MIIISYDYMINLRGTTDKLVKLESIIISTLMSLYRD